MTTVIETNYPNILHRGKVRDTYDLGNGYLLMIATDRISAFDVVLPTPIPRKGLVLAQLSAFWFRRTAHLVLNHLLCLASETERLPREVASHPLIASLSEDMRRRSMVVRRAQRVDIECVVRGYLAGSAWEEYAEKGTIFDRPFPTGLREGERLPELLFTPTTKAEVGHDLPMSDAEVEAMVGADMARRLREKSFAVYEYARDYAAQRGIIIADTKLEIGLIEGELALIDELLTPDSSRFWEGASWSPGTSQPNFDKQFVRDWLTDAGWNREPPAPELPPEVVEKTSQRYVDAYRRLVGQDPSW